MTPSPAPGVTTEDLVIDPGGRSLAARWWRPADDLPDAPAIVLLHEALGSIDMWKGFPERLAAQLGCPVLAYDRQGHGGSPPLEGPRDMAYVHDLALQELPAVLDFCGIEAPILFGHSDGGSIALIHAARHPVRALVTEAAHVFVEDLTLSGITDNVEVWQNTDLPQRLARYHGDKTEALFFAWADTWRQAPFRYWNIENLLPDITCPALVIQGTGDEYGTDEQVHAITRQLGGTAESLLIPDCAHIPHLQAQPRVLEAVAGFLDLPGAG